VSSAGRARLLAGARAVLERNWTGTFSRPGSRDFSWTAALVADLLSDAPLVS